eukprot:969686-Pelagomonas_calceolata.AAC.1
MAHCWSSPAHCNRSHQHPEGWLMCQGEKNYALRQAVKTFPTLMEEKLSYIAIALRCEGKQYPVPDFDDGPGIGPWHSSFIGTTDIASGRLEVRFCLSEKPQGEDMFITAFGLMAYSRKPVNQTKLQLLVDRRRLPPPGHMNSSTLLAPSQNNFTI